MIWSLQRLKENLFFVNCRLQQKNYDVRCIFATCKMYSVILGPYCILNDISSSVCNDDACCSKQEDM